MDHERAFESAEERLSSALRRVEAGSLAVKAQLVEALRAKDAPPQEEAAQPHVDDSALEEALLAQETLAAELAQAKARIAELEADLEALTAPDAPAAPEEEPAEEPEAQSEEPEAEEIEAEEQTAQEPQAELDDPAPAAAVVDGQAYEALLAEVQDLRNAVSGDETSSDANRILQLEIDVLRGARASDRSELQQVITQLETLIQEAAPDA